MRKRIGLTILALIIGVMLLPACGKKSSSNTDKKGPGEVIDAGTVSALCPSGWKSYGDRKSVV